MGKIIAVLLMLFWTSSALAACIDKSMIPLEEKRAAMVKEKCGEPEGVFSKFYDCERDLKPELDKLYPIRGTKEYAREHYANLTVEEADEKVTELYQCWKKIDLLNRDTAPGSLSQWEIDYEGTWLQRKIFGVKWGYGLKYSDGVPAGFNDDDDY